MTRSELHALKIIAALGECYGRDVVLCSGSVLKRGTVYVTLGLMEQRGLLTSREEDYTPPHISIPRRLYRLTERAEFILGQLEARPGNDPGLDQFAADRAP